MNEIMLENINDQAQLLEQNLSERSHKADKLYAKLVLLQTDKQPASNGRLNETMNLLSTS